MKHALQKWKSLREAVGLVEVQCLGSRAPCRTLYALSPFSKFSSGAKNSCLSPHCGSPEDGQESWPLEETQCGHVGGFPEEKAFPGLANQSTGKEGSGKECPVPCQAWGGEICLAWGTVALYSGLVTRRTQRRVGLFQKGEVVFIFNYFYCCYCLLLVLRTDSGPPTCEYTLCYELHPSHLGVLTH